MLKNLTLQLVLLLRGGMLISVKTLTEENITLDCRDNKPGAKVVMAHHVVLSFRGRAPTQGSPEGLDEVPNTGDKPGAKVVTASVAPLSFR